ncbi:MAG: TolC family protein [Flavobacteriales bacterium]
MKNKRLFLAFLWAIARSWGQVPLTEQAFLEVVLKNHPMVLQSNLKPLMGGAAMLKAKGAFDPKFSGSLEQKYYDGNQYYSLSDFGLSLPTWYGLTVKSGLESNRGSYMDPQAKTPGGGLFYGGIYANLGQGLMIDQRRADIQKAEVFKKQNDQEQRYMLNQLVYESGYSYWNWFLAYHTKEIVLKAYEVATQRFEAIKTTAELGDRAFIDTVEAGLQVQNRLSMLREAEMRLANEAAIQETFLWTPETEPLTLSSNSLPSALRDWNASIALVNYADSMVENHPYLQISQFKIDALEIDQKLKRDRLKPLVEFNYNLLNEPVNYNPFSSLNINDYKWGMSVQMPLFLRKERGDLQLARLKINDAQLELKQTKAYLKMKIQTAGIELSNSLNQLNILNQTVNDSKALLDAEKEMFENGESSLFLINMRELAYVQSELKRLEWMAKNKQLGYTLGFSTATLY